MNIIPVDTEYRIFSVENFLSTDLVNQILTIDWHTIGWTRGSQQESWLRRQLDVSTIEVFQHFDNQVLENKLKIEKELRIKFEYYPFTMWWYDEPNFIVPIHTDGHLPCSMQLYWAADSYSYGTTFFEYKNSAHIKYQFDFKPNCGYLMLNGLDINESQPLQWHGMLDSVQNYRISSYTNFGKYISE